jgi:hypothetical protein
VKKFAEKRGRGVSPGSAPEARASR